MIAARPDAASVRQRALRSLDRLPPFSPVVNRLVATLAREDVSFSELASLIEKDTVIAGNVLRLVNSALYNLQGTVNSVRHAVAILGLNKLRNVALSLSVAGMWRQAPGSAGWPAARFNAHSVATGILADLIAARTDVDYPEGAFVAGLLHDMGKLLIAISSPDEATAVRKLVASSARSWSDCELEIMGVTHAELSGAVLERWNLPPPIREAAELHHAPSGDAHLSRVVHAADALANGVGHSVLSAPQPPDSAPALDALGLADATSGIRTQFEPEFATLRAFF